MPNERPLIGNRVLLAFVLVTLTLVSIRSALDIRTSLSEQDDSDEAAAEASEALRADPGSADDAEPLRTVPQPSSRPPGIEDSGNEVDAERLLPTLLDDRAEIEQYVAEFPEDEYEVAEVEGQGKFYLDDKSDFIKEILASGEVWEPAIQDALRRVGRPGATIIDAGAHIGTHTVTLSKIAGPEGRVYAFEPQRKIYRELVHNVSLNELENVVPLRFALGDRHTVIEMDPATEANEGDTMVGSGGDSAELRTLDSFGFRNVGLIKIDVEGFEKPVLRGGRQTIAEQKPVLLVEIQGGHSFDNAPRNVRAEIVDTIQWIEAMGYHVYRITMYDYLALPLLPPTATEPS